jgi:NhaP-type Na+/H+ or K+/H+ antiporter
VGAQWLAWRLRVPAILPLLVTGLVAGPGAAAVLGHKLLAPNALFGPLLLPGVSLSVAVILFEGGLSLRRSELVDVGHVVRNLVTIGALVTWGLTSLLVWSLGLLGPQNALVLGAILTVTGPTVIGPLLQHTRLRGPAATVLKWEGIVIDPIGAILAVLAFEVTQGANVGHGAAAAGVALLKTLLVGGCVGAAGAALLVATLRRHWSPDVLENAVSLMVVVATFALANRLQEESGLLAVTVLGIAVANQVREQELRHIVEFKENLKVLLLSSLFVILAARLDTQELFAALGWRSGLFVALMIVLVRPLSVLASTLGSRLTWRERAFVAATAPRGIVAAAVSAVFALRLVEAGHPQALTIPSITVLVIVVTVTVSGLLSSPLARWLGLSDPDPQGLLFVGAHGWARSLALTLQHEGVDVLLIDNNHSNIAEAHLAGLKAQHANVLSDYVLSELDLGGVGRLLAMTPNDEVNTLAAERLAQAFGGANVFQLPPRAAGSRRHDPHHHHRVRYLFGPDETYWQVSDRVEGGGVIKATRLGEEFTFPDWRARYGPESVPLFLVSKKGVQVFATDRPPTPAPGDTLVGLVPPDEPRAPRPEPTPTPTSPPPEAPPPPAVLVDGPPPLAPAPPPAASEG